MHTVLTLTTWCPTIYELTANGDKKIAEPKPDGRPFSAAAGVLVVVEHFRAYERPLPMPLPRGARVVLGYYSSRADAPRGVGVFCPTTDDADVPAKHEPVVAVVGDVVTDLRTLTTTCALMPHAEWTEREHPDQARSNHWSGPLGPLGPVARRHHGYPVFPPGNPIPWTRLAETGSPFPFITHEHMLAMAEDLDQLVVGLGFVQKRQWSERGGVDLALLPATSILPSINPHPSGAHHPPLW